MDINMKVVQTTVVQLELPRDVALWLKGLLQNPVGNVDLTEECQTTITNRHLLWNALNSKAF